MPQLILPGGKARKEKYLRAEQKNRLERTRLDLTQKFFDREAFKTKFRIDREKKLVIRAFDLVKRTSGASDEGCPPSGHHDRDYEKSVVFKNGLRLTELRLNNWRHLEKDLDSFLANIERDMEKDSPQCSQRDRFQQQGKQSDMLMKGIGLRPKKRVFVPRSTQENPTSTEQVSVESAESESDYSASYDSDLDSESDYSDSGSSDLSIGAGRSVRLDTYDSVNSDSQHKRVTFARPHTTGNLLRGRSQDEHSRRSQTPSVVEDTTHFVITKGGVLMSTGSNGQYKNIGGQNNPQRSRPETASAGSLTSTTTPLKNSKVSNPHKKHQDVSVHVHSPGGGSVHSPGGGRSSRASRRRVASPCSETSSVFSSPFRDRCCSSTVKIPRRNRHNQIYSDGPNSRLGIFLPPEKEFKKRQHFSNRQLDAQSPRSLASEEICGWKSRLISGHGSKVRIRSMASMATVLRAAMVFSRKSRQKILTAMMKEEEFEHESSGRL